jgi:NitT/TauT family transport system substrate-binding protein
VKNSNGVAGLAGFTAACVIIATMQSAFATEKVWRHGILLPKADAGILMMVSTQGFAEKRGLKIELVPMKDDPLLIRALLAGKLDSIEGGPAIAITAGSRNADLKILGCHWPSLPHGVFVRNNIGSVQDLKGKTVAIAGPGGLPDVLMRALFEKFSVPTSDINFASLGGDVERFKALTVGVVDATVVSMEYVPVAAKSDVKLLVAARDVLPNYLRICIETTGSTLNARRNDAIAFIAAEMSALRYAMTHREDAMHLTREMAHVSPNDPRPEFVFDDAVQHKSVDPDMPIPMEKLSWMQDQLIKIGTLKAPYDLAKIVDKEIRAEALGIADR